MFFFLKQCVLAAKIINHFLGCVNKYIQQAITAPCLQLVGTMSGALCPILGFPLSERHCHTAASAAGGYPEQHMIYKEMLGIA